MSLTNSVCTQIVHYSFYYCSTITDASPFSRYCSRGIFNLKYFPEKTYYESLSPSSLKPFANSNDPMIVT